MKKAVIFFDKILLCLVFLPMFVLCGCNLIANTDTYEYVDMSPRQISISNSVDTVTLVENVKSAVVGIACSVSGGYSIGSGVAIREGGYILTNEHVISGAKSITIYFADKTNASATLIWKDKSQDLAVIKSSKDMPYLVCSNETVKTGEDIIAIGTPLSLDFRHTVTKGIISAINRTVELENSNGTVSYMQNLIQHDASINPGNSGGPIINYKGEVVGINTLKASEAEGIGFAIPISIGSSIVKNISQNSNWKSSYMGIFSLDNDVAIFKGNKIDLTQKGVFIAGIDQNCESKNCFKNGDIILEINNVKINSVLDLRLEIYKYNSGDILNIKLIRDGKEMEIRYNLQEKM